MKRAAPSAATRTTMRYAFIFQCGILPSAPVYCGAVYDRPMIPRIAFAHLTYAAKKIFPVAGCLILLNHQSGRRTMGNSYPTRPIVLPLMLQRWHEICFFHWSCDPQLLQPRLPPGLRLDTFDSKAWIGLTPFLLTGLRPPLFPQALGLAFPEMNLRTYVIGADGPGIWFFSLDAARFVAVLGARAMYGLPYYWA